MKKVVSEVVVKNDLVESPGKTKESLKENEKKTSGNDIKSDQENTEQEDASVKTEERAVVEVGRCW